MSQQIISYWAKAIETNKFYIVYWHPRLKHAILVKTSDKPKAGERLW